MPVDIEKKATRKKESLSARNVAAVKYFLLCLLFVVAATIVGIDIVVVFNVVMDEHAKRATPFRVQMCVRGIE